MAERLQKIISQAGIASRREAEAFITAGRVRVNGTVVTELGTKAEPWDHIQVDGKPIVKEQKIYILLNKPKGFVTTLDDPDGRKTVVDLLKDVKERVYPVGRLDYNTEGLLLLTNDGALTHGLTHPSHEVDKTYIAEIMGIAKEEELDRLRMGIKLEDGITSPAKVEKIADDYELGRSRISLTIHEGKNRQVRRMCEAIGHPVRKLKRTRYAFLTLSGVKRGRYRHLTEEEVQELQNIGKAPYSE